MLSAAAVLTLSACGGGDASEPAAATPPASPAPAATAQTADAKPRNVRQSVNFPAKFERRIDAKCKRAEADVNAITRHRYTPERYRQVRDVMEELAADFEQIDAPARNRRAWRNYRTQVRDLADFVGRVESDVAEGDVDGFSKLVRRAKGVDGRTKRLSLRYGFQECADD